MLDSFKTLIDRNRSIDIHYLPSRKNNKWQGSVQRRHLEQDETFYTFRPEGENRESIFVFAKGTTFEELLDNLLKKL